MAGITDKPTRRIIASFGAGIMYSEMVAINAISFKNKKSLAIADVRDEPYDVIVQLMGNNPELFAQVIPAIEDLGAKSIDINMGCPAKKIVNNQSGSSLMKDIKLAQEIIKKSKKATKLDLSVKFRLGWDDNSKNYIEFAKMAEGEGANYITVHGRTRAQFYAGKADWTAIKELKQHINIPLIGNGDIDSPAIAKECLEASGVDGLMIGRATLGQPWIIKDIDDYINSGISNPQRSILQIKQILLTHLKGLIDYYGEYQGLRIARKYVGWYSKSMKNAKKFREEFMKISTLDSALDKIEEFMI